MDHEERGNDCHVALLDESNSLLVEKRRVLDRVDPRLRCDAHPARAVRVRGNAEPGLVRFGDRGCRLLRGVLRDLRWRALAEDAARRKELDHLRAGRDLLPYRLAHLVGPVGDPPDLEAMATGRRDAAAARHDARPFEQTLLDRAAEVDHHRSVRA